MQRVRAQDIGNSRNDFRGNPQDLSVMVPGNLVGDMPKERSQCFGLEAHAWSWKLASRGERFSIKAGIDPEWPRNRLTPSKSAAQSRSYSLMGKRFPWRRERGGAVAGLYSISQCEKNVIFWGIKITFGA